MFILYFSRVFLLRVKYTMYVSVCMCVRIFILVLFFSIGMTFFGFANHNPLWLNKNCQTIFYVVFYTMNKYEQKNIRNANIKRYTFIQPLLYTITLILYSFKRFFWLLFFLVLLLVLWQQLKNQKMKFPANFPMV